MYTVLCCVCYVSTVLCSFVSFSRAEAMASEIKELQGEMADINTVRLIDNLFVNSK